MKTKILHICIALGSLLALCACAPKQPQTIEEYNLNQIFEQCKTSASEMNDGVKNSSNPLWNAYFEMCMSTNGYKPADYKNLWY